MGTSWAYHRTKAPRHPRGTVTLHLPLPKLHRLVKNRNNAVALCGNGFNKGEAQPWEKDLKLQSYSHLAWRKPLTCFWATLLRIASNTSRHRSHSLTHPMDSNILRSTGSPMVWSPSKEMVWHVARQQSRGPAGKQSSSWIIGRK